MPDFVLALGDIGFFDFEVPQHIATGLEQTIVLHRYVGGARTADAMGPDFHPITWEGVFTGPSAEWRWNAVGAMCVDGLPVPLTWSAFSKTVLVQKADIKFRRFWHIEYSITCLVIVDQNFPQYEDDSIDLDDQMGGDMSDVVSGFIDISSTNGVVAGVTVGPLSAGVTVGPGGVSGGISGTFGPVSGGLSVGPGGVSGGATGVLGPFSATLSGGPGGVTGGVAGGVGPVGGGIIVGPKGVSGSVSGTTGIVGGGATFGPNGVSAGISTAGPLTAQLSIADMNNLGVPVVYAGS